MPSHRPASCEHHPDGLEDDLYVPAEAPVDDVVRVQLHHFLEVRDLRAAADLPQAGDARLRRQTRAVVEFVFLPLVHRRGTGAYQAHLALQDVEELRELIQARGADELPDTGLLLPVLDPVPDDPRIPVQLEHHPAAVLPQLLFALLRVQVHGPQLIDLELFPVLAHPRLFKEDRAGALLFDLRADDGHDDQGQQASCQSAQDVQRPL